MPKGARTRASLLLAAALLGLAACGGEDSSGGEGGDGDRDAVTAAITQAAKSTNPADCTRLQTQRFLDQSETEEGAAAVRSCREDAEDGADNPKSIAVAKVEVDDRRATARAAFRGGDIDGQALNLSLVKQGGQWKLDHIDSFAKFDRRRFLRAARRAFARPPDALPPVVAACVVRRLGRLSDAALKRLTVEPSREGVIALVTPCLPQEPDQGGDEGDPAAARTPERARRRSA
ncbi:MAG: hypothetical protein H0T43_11740 [Solirubrobacterales bacterium]|nr:hypothetical protein [Solirubrobacterales bacterium]